MRSLRSQAISCGWIRDDESILIPRLSFPLASELPGLVHDANRAVREAVLDELLTGTFKPVGNPSIFSAQEEIVVAETDRYGLPLRTVLGTQTGLMRSDPYYCEEFLSHFYSQRYRNLYRPKRFSLSWFLAEQIRAGQRIVERVQSRLPSSANVLDIGCGMGGNLVAFRFAGCKTTGCDYGNDYANHGRALGLDIRTGGIESVQNAGPFDLVILSHVLEHVTDPVKFLAQVASLLKLAGICYIEVPGLLNLEQACAGDILDYLQNAHRWHFTRATLNAVLQRAGLQIEEADEFVHCIAARGPADAAATPSDGATVLEKIERLELQRESSRELAGQSA